MVGQCRRRWTDIMQMLYKCSVFAGSAADLPIYPRSRVLLIRVPLQLPGERTALQPFRRWELITYIVISVLLDHHSHLSVVKHFYNNFILHIRIS